MERRSEQNGCSRNAVSSDEEWFGVVEREEVVLVEYEQWKAKVKAHQEKEQTND